jgi:hypothetical protein
MTDWFWLITYGEMFAGLSGCRLRVAVKAVRDSVSDGLTRWSGASPFRSRGLPTSADFRAVRIRAFALQLARIQRASRPSEDAFELLSAYRRFALYQLVPRNRVSSANYSSPANRFLCAPDEAKELRQAILSGQIDASMQSMHVIPEESRKSAVQGRWDDLLSAGSRVLKQLSS